MANDNDSSNNPDMIEVHSSNGSYPDEIQVTNANAQAAGEAEPK